MSSKRGLYKKTKNKMVKERPSNFFREDHENKGSIISWSDIIDRGNGRKYVLYKLYGEKNQFRCPRWKTAWMDSKSLEASKKIVSDWKMSNNNSIGRGNLIPEFYVNHRVEYIKWLANTSKHSTISGYERFLRMYIFPFFYERLELKSPKKWDLDSIARWEVCLCEHLNKASSRNRARTALRRYFKFLKFKNEIKIIPQIYDEAVRRDSRETIIPGALPNWDDVLRWLRSLPKGRYRFVKTICVAFGLRISEADAIEVEDFIGAESEEHIDIKNDFIKKIKDKNLGALFLYVNKANKKRVSSDLIRILGKQDNEPKSGPYTACCTNKEVALFILEMIQNEEHLMALKKDQIYKIIKNLPMDYSEYKFHEYKPHDDRRLNITLQCLDLDIDDRVEICCQLHGQSSRDVFFKYFQWGLMQKRKQSNTFSKRKIEVFQV